MQVQFGPGHEIIDFIPCNTPFSSELLENIPITWVYNLVTYHDKYVLMHNFNRMQWEMPGGGVEVGEDPDDAARREIMEETCQQVQDLKCRAMFKCCLKPDHRYEWGVLYTARVSELLPFILNNESDRITLWSEGNMLDDQLSDLATVMLRLMEAHL